MAWNTVPTHQIDFEHPETGWPMRAFLFRDGMLEVLAIDDGVATLAHENEADGCFDEAQSWAHKLTHLGYTVESAVQALKDEGIDTSGWEVAT